eukprot:7202343-Alexandrium_andersonii.AAC.1
MAADALRLQEEFVLGGSDRGDTVDVEADESVFGHWKAGEGQHCWWIWLGLKQRGAHESLWLTCLGVWESQADEHGAAKPPQLTSDEWLSVLDKKFSRDTRA